MPQSHHSTPAQSLTRLVVLKGCKGRCCNLWLVQPFEERPSSAIGAGKGKGRVLTPDRGCLASNAVLTSKPLVKWKGNHDANHFNYRLPRSRPRIEDNGGRTKGLQFHGRRQRPTGQGRRRRKQARSHLVQRWRVGRTSASVQGLSCKRETCLRFGLISCASLD